MNGGDGTIALIQMTSILDVLLAKLMKAPAKIQEENEMLLIKNLRIKPFSSLLLLKMFAQLDKKG